MNVDLNRTSTEVKTEVTSTIRAKLEWNVDKLDLDQTESRRSIRSPPFIVPVCGEDTEWFISIYPKGTALHGRGEQAAYIYLHHTPPGAHTGSDTEYSMAFRTDCGSWPEDHAVCRKGMRTTEEWRKGGYGYMKMCPTEDLANMYMDDLSVSSVGDTMTAVTVIVKRKLVIVVWLKIAVPEENRKRSDEFNSNMKNIFEMKNFSDVVLKCNGQDFPCHKVVLSARSDVFKAMLENEMKEAHDNVIAIIDSSPEIVTMMVEHIYTGKIPEVVKLKQLAPEILHIAVKYNLPSLVSVCEDTMLNELKSANAIKTFIYVDRYMPNSKLREQVLKFLVRNAREVVGVGDWGDFIKQFPELATEMFRNVIDNSGQAGPQAKLPKKSRMG